MAEAPPSMTKMTLTPATMRLQQQTQQQPSTGQRPQQQLGTLLDTFTGARVRGLGAGSRPVRPRVWQQQPLLGAQRPGIEMQRLAPRPAGSSGGVIREQDADLLRRVVAKQVALGEQQERRRQQQQQQQQQQPAPVEEVDLTGEPSSPLQQPAAVRPAVQVERPDWRAMVQRVKERAEQEGLINLESDLGPPRPPLQSPLLDGALLVDGCGWGE